MVSACAVFRGRSRKSPNTGLYPRVYPALLACCSSAGSASLSRVLDEAEEAFGAMKSRPGFLPAAPGQTHRDKINGEHAKQSKYRFQELRGQLPHSDSVFPARSSHERYELGPRRSPDRRPGSRTRHRWRLRAGRPRHGTEPTPRGRPTERNPPLAAERRDWVRPIQQVRLASERRLTLHLCSDRRSGLTSGLAARDQGNLQPQTSTRSQTHVVLS